MCSLLDIDKQFKRRKVIPNGGERFLLTGKSVPPYDGHNDFDVKKIGSPGYYTIATATETAYLWIEPGTTDMCISETIAVLLLHYDNVKEVLAICLDVTN